ncbi:MAG: 5-formyltetrahydrofolate cyclo-ligase [Pseudobdellovibrionaceae bacterium]
MTEHKASWRLYFKDQMKARATNPLSIQESQLKNNLRAFLAPQSGNWATYYALPGEPPAESVLDFSESILGVCEETTQIKSWAFPKVSGERLSFYRIKSKTDLCAGPFGILEPNNSCQKVDLSDLNGILIPGLGFDRKGTRLGRGKAFYDKTLDQYDGIKAGVAWSFQVTEEELPKESTDIQMDVVISDRGIQWFSGRREV